MRLEALEPRHLLAVTSLIDGATVARAFVPTENDYDELGLDWVGSAEPFDDSAWTATPVGGPNGVGYPVTGAYSTYIGADIQADMRTKSLTSYVRIAFTATDVAQFASLTLKMRFDDGFIAYLNGVEIERVNVPAADVYPAWSTPASAGTIAGASYTSYDVSGHVSALREGENVLAIRGFVTSLASILPHLVQAALDAETFDTPPTANDDAVTMPSDGPPAVIDVLANDTPGAAAIDPTTVEVVGQPSDGTAAVDPVTGAITYMPNAGFRGTDTFTYRVRDTSPLPTPGETTEEVVLVSPTTAAHRTLVPTNDALGLTWTGGNEPFNDASWVAGVGGIGYDLDVTTDFSPFINDNVQQRVYNVNASIYERIAFTADPATTQGLRLRLRYDDGFVAYINGVRVAESFAPAQSLYNSEATGQNTDAAALQQQEFVVDMDGVTLRGEANANVLAIHALNWVPGSSDLLMQAELVADVGITGLWSNEATVTVNVTGTGPLAVDDSAQTTGAAAVAIAVLDNDMVGEPPNDYPLRPESVRIVEPPAHGTATVDPQTGAITYQAVAGFSGQDMLRYTVRDEAPVGGETGSVVLLPQGAVWKYLDNGSDQGTAWTGVTFDDSGWSSGAAELGYGDGDEATVVGFGPDSNNKYVTTYFRRTFDLVDASAVQLLDVLLEYDDGAVVYINGTEVHRENMPAGTITYASLAVGGADYPRTPTSVAMLTGAQLAVLRNGTNVVAVEIHQGSRGSSDISFDFQLVAELDAPTGRVSNSATVTIDVASTGEPPTANDDDVLTKIEQPIDIDILANDEPGGAFIDATSVAIVAGPTSGSVTVQSNGHVLYAPNAAFTGSDSFTYTVQDTAGVVSNVATVAVLVVSSIPMPADDLYYVDEDDVLNVPASFGVLRNDTDDGGVLESTTLAAPPEHGTVTLDADGGFQYVPAADFFGDDQFRYRATDNFGVSAEATVTVRVSPSPDAPIALGDVYSTTMDTPLVVVATSSMGRQSLVPEGSEWRYLDDGTTFGSSWRQSTFDDSLWPVGQAQFGYGDGDEVTVVRFGDDFNTRHVTTYFRHAFIVTEPTNVHALQLGLLRDDGAAVAINGGIVVTSNMPSSFGGTTFAVSSVAGDEEDTFLPFDISPDRLVSGRNVIAVEVHQASATSSDMSFDLYLHGDVAGPVTDGVLLNDVDVDGDYLTARLVSPPAHGTLAFSADGGFTYRPEAGFVGADAFTYRGYDGVRLSEVATVVINVAPPAAMAADLNDDGVVNAADLAMVVAGLGTTDGADKYAGDANDDGLVDVKDVAAVQRAFGQTRAENVAAPGALVAGRRDAVAATDAALVGGELRPLVARAARRTGVTIGRRDRDGLFASHVDRSLGADVVRGWRLEVGG